MQKNLIFTGLIFSLISTGMIASGCTAILPDPHKIDIQQGNRIKPEDLEKLELGMTRHQVKFVLGTPLLTDAFHRNRWDYLFYLRPGEGKVRQSRVSLYFEGDSLVRIDDSAYKPEMQELPVE